MEGVENIFALIINLKIGKIHYGNPARWRELSPFQGFKGVPMGTVDSFFFKLLTKYMCRRNFGT